MKKLLIIGLLLSGISLATIAQNPVSQLTKAPGIGSVLTNLGNGLNPASFLSSFKLPDWLSSVSKLSPTNASGAASLLGQLGKGLNPSSLMQGFSTKDWASKLKSASTVSAVATEAESLIKNIKPEAFKSGFDPSSLTSALDLLKK
jgi:hypothetical protein